ncbi:MAG: hypothetical protein F4X76_01920 [Chloroflexi bacterium]|nr:hypothetical protein [Chloroflexota bacterium]
MPALAAFGAGLLAAVLLWSALFALRGDTDEEFDVAHLVRWEFAALANKWLFAAGEPLRDDPAPDEAIAAVGARAPGGAVEGRGRDPGGGPPRARPAAAAIREQGLSFPLSLPGALAVWPPLDIELTPSPHVLVISPRGEIRRQDERILQFDLSLDDLYRIEREAEERDGSIASFVAPTGGIAFYPAIVDARSYRGAVSTAAHEWVHHYLIFYPLGRAYFADADARTINETVASLVGWELRDAALERFGDPTASARPAAAPPAARAEGIDRNAVLRELRLEVDALLAEGRVAEAERRMEEVRLMLADHGFAIRRINQAYFAWYGTYAARADAVDPLGGQLRELRERAGSLARFLELVRGITTRAEVEALLASMDSTDSAGG